MLSAFLASGCSATRLHNKAVKKGYVHTIHVDTLKVAYVDTFYKDGKPYPVIKYKDSIILQTITEYIPKWRIRFDNKRFADSLAHIRAMYEDSLRNALKTQKIQLKQEAQTQKQQAKQKTKQIRTEAKPTLKMYITGVFLGVLIFFIGFFMAKFTKFLV
jgi:hypothetical protein